MATTILVRADEQCDVHSETLRKQGFRLGLRPLFPGQFYELPADTVGIKTRVSGDIAHYEKVPLGKLPVAEVTVKDVAQAIIEKKQRKEALAKQSAQTGWVADAVRMAEEMLAGKGKA